MKKIIITEDHPKMRLDVFVSQSLGLSRSKAVELIKSQALLLNEKICSKASVNVGMGDCIEIKEKSGEITEKCMDSLSLGELQASKRELGEIKILHQDDEILLLNKPPNLVIHNAPSVKEATLLDWLKCTQQPLDSLSANMRYGIVHRLDKFTSGILAVARSQHAHKILSDQLKARQMGRYYLAVITPPLKSDTLIECYMGRNPKNRLKMAKLGDCQSQVLQTNQAQATQSLEKHPRQIPWRYSKSAFVKLLDSKDAKLELIAVKLFTGRTHQIRVHLESINRHILGDTLYGSMCNHGYGGRILLHAYIMYLYHPKYLQQATFLQNDLAPSIFKAPLFADMLDFLEEFFDKDSLHEVLDTEYILERFCL
ncbi:MAG: RluA family pseudouridine synthase [Helicobacter sp.]|nr:RluA family pseudouridine synthase [Helicobacter sp.]